MKIRQIDNSTIDHAVDLALAGDVRPWPFPDDYMVLFDEFASHPDPSSADELKHLGHKALAERAHFRELLAQAQTPDEVRAIARNYQAASAAA